MLGAQVSLQRDCSLLALALGDGLGDGVLDTSTADFLGELANGEGSSLSVDHDAETIEIIEGGAFVSLFHFLGRGGGGELLGELVGLGSLVNSGGPGAAEDGQSELGEGESAHGVQAAGEVLAIDEHLLGVNPVHDDNKLAVILSEVNVSDSAGFDEISKDLQIRHTLTISSSILLY